MFVDVLDCTGDVAVLALVEDDDVDTLLTLPGVGSYTARAIACFAYRRRVPVVDTNVRRVEARLVFRGCAVLHGDVAWRRDMVTCGAMSELVSLAT